VKRWRPELAGVILVWRDPADGRVFVVNGHHRLALARRLGVAEVDVRFIAARDAAEARAIGALANMAEGRATPVDVAKFIRDSGRTPESLAAEGISLNETLARDGLSLAKLHPQLFASVATGVLPLGRALAIAVLTRHEDQARLAALAEHLERRRTISDPLIREMAADMETAPRQTVEQADLFGSYVDEKSLFLERN
jgi:ParB-like chromosome segregation protein Spo0J